MKKSLCLMVALFSVAVILIACEKAMFGPVEEEKPTTVVGEVAMPTPSINVATIAIHSGDKLINVSAEIAKTDEERAKGLMGRESLPKNYGMWFVFPNDVHDSFWMKDTLISLDMIFVGSDMKIVDIIANAQPQSTDLLMPKAPYRYVLEVAGGFAAANGIAIGNQVEQRIGPAQ